MCGLVVFFVLMAWSANTFEGWKPWKALLVSFLVVVLWPLDILGMVGYMVWEAVVWLVKNEPIKYREPPSDIGL